MQEHLQYLILGLGSGAVVTALALGVVLTYRSARVLNVAHAAMGMYVGLAYLELRRTGQLVLPVLGLPDRIRLVPEGVVPTAATAIPVALVLAAALGLLVHLLVFRPLRTAPILARVVASLGLFLYLLSMVNLRFDAQGAALSRPTPILPNDLISIAGIELPRDRLLLAAIVVMTAFGLAAMFRFTRFGLVTRAAAENEKGAILLGHAPDRIAAVNWMLASTLAGGAVVLSAPIAGLDATRTSLLIVPALAAALLGRFESFLVTVAAGLTIGALQSELLNVQTTWDWLPDNGLQQGLPLVVIIATMAWRGRSLPGRGDTHHVHFPHSPHPRHLGAGMALLVIGGSVALVTASADWRNGIIISSIFGLMALSVVVLTGFVGQISLAPLAFAGVAAFTMVNLSNDFGVPFPFAPLGGALVATALGVLLGIPAVRVRGMNLAIVTLAAATAIEELVLKWDWLAGGDTGANVPRPGIGGFDLGIGARGDAYPRPAFGILCLAVLALATLLVANLRRGDTGLHWLAIRGNERAAAAVGIDVSRAKLSAFAVSAFLAGIGGTLLAYQRQTLSADSFVVLNSLALVAMTYLGGIASVGGAVIAGLFANGGVLTVATAATSSDASHYQFAVNGILLIAVAIGYPEGIAGALSRMLDRLRRPRIAPGARLGGNAATETAPAAPRV